MELFIYTRLSEGEYPFYRFINREHCLHIFSDNSFFDLRDVAGGYAHSAVDVKKIWGINSRAVYVPQTKFEKIRNKIYQRKNSQLNINTESNRGSL